MSTNKNGRVSIANILALIGLAGIGVVSFFGMFLHAQDGAPGGAVIGAVALTLGLALLLFMSIKAKSAEDSVDKWKFVEWTALAAYVVVAALCAGPFQRFFYVVSEKEQLQSLARQEIQSIKELQRNYEYQSNKFLTDAAEQIQNYIDSHQAPTVDRALAEYADNVGPNVGDWKRKAQAIVALPKDEQLLEIESEVEVWNILKVASLAAELEAKESSAWSDLEKKIRLYGENNRLIPKIVGGGVTPYAFDGYFTVPEFGMGEKPHAAFAERLREMDGHTVIGWVVYVLLHLLVLLNYVVTRRSQMVAPRSNRNTGGMNL